MSFIRKNIKNIGISAYLFFLPLLSHAFDTPPDTNTAGGIHNPLQVDSLSELIILVLNGLLKLLIPILVLYIIWAGLRLVLARGNAEEIKKAKTGCLVTLIGTSAVIAAYPIAQLIDHSIKALS